MANPRAVTVKKENRKERTPFPYDGSRTAKFPEFYQICPNSPDSFDLKLDDATIRQGEVNCQLTRVGTQYRDQFSLLNVQADIPQHRFCPIMLSHNVV